MQAQQNNSLYYMVGLPQSNQLNPATQPKCGFFIGLPSLEVNGGNTNVSFKDILIYDPKVDSLFYFLKNSDAQKNFLDKIQGNLNLSADARLDIISLGFRIRNTYLTFGISQRIETRVVIPHDLIMVEGNLDSIGGTKKSLDLSGLGINASYFSEYSFGISHQFGDKLTIGIKAKFLYGLANISTKSYNVYMNDGGPDTYKIGSAIDLNASVPNLTVHEGVDGRVDSLSFKNVKNVDEAKTLLMDTKNMGLAFDVGIIYKPLEKISFSMSILDLGGYINWKDNLHRFKQDGNYDFKGVLYNPNDTSKITDAILDTLKNHFTYSDNPGGYKTTLSPKFYAGALFQLTKGIGLGFLTRQQILDHKLNSQYTFSLNLYPANMLNITLSYTIADQMYDNFGMGFTFKLGFLQAYVMSERIPLYWYWAKNLPNKGDSGIPVPYDAKNFNLHAGINFVLGYNHRTKKIKQDKPLVDL